VINILQFIFKMGIVSFYQQEPKVCGNVLAQMAFS
jgi:hypothetical protein